MRCPCGESAQRIERHPEDPERDEFRCEACGQTFRRYETDQNPRIFYPPLGDHVRQLPRNAQADDLQQESVHRVGPADPQQLRSVPQGYELPPFPFWFVVGIAIIATSALLRWLNW